MSSLPDRLRLPLSFDDDRLRKDAALLPAEGWVAHFIVENYEGDWDALPLRCPHDAVHPVQQIFAAPGATRFVDTPHLATLPYIRDVLAAFHCPLRSVRLLRLTPGSHLKEHTDHDISFDDGSVRLHIPVTTNPDVLFLLNGTRVIMEAGSVWYLRLSDPHSVTNGGTGDRIHMALDAERNPWLEALMAEAVGRAAT